jgi:hypothetical protein
VDCIENQAVIGEQDISDRLRKEYNLLKNEFHSKIDRLTKKREKLKEVQKTYFGKAKKHRGEKARFIMKHRDAYKKPKIEEYFQKREYYYRQYKMNFRDFKQLYEKSNYQFEQRVLGWIKFDTQLKKDYVKIWQNLMCKILGIDPNAPVLLGLPDIDELFDDVLVKDLETIENGKSTIYSKVMWGK